MTERKTRKAKPAEPATVDYEPAVTPRADLHLAPLDECLERLAMVMGTPTMIYDRKTLIPMKPADARNIMSRQTYKEWSNHPCRQVLMPDEVVFDPSEACPPHYINLFRGMPLKPIKGDCSEALELLRHLLSESSEFPDEVEANIRYVLRWIALVVQKPGTKMATALVFHGPQGSGKSLFWSIVVRLFGEYGKFGGQAQLEGRWNDVYSACLLMVFEEISSPGELLHVKNALKNLITSDYLLIESKFQPVRKERNHANFVFLSNEAKPLALEADDRRYAVFWTAGKRTDGLYMRVARSLKYGALEAFYHYLLHLDLGDFNEHTPPPWTTAKHDLVNLGLKPAERFLRDWLARDLELPLWVCSTGQLYKAFQRWARMQGEKTVVNQNVFTATAAKYARDQLTRLKCMPPRGADGKLVNTPITLWLPEGTGPRQGVTNFEFAQESVAAFDGALAKFGNGMADL